MTEWLPKLSKAGNQKVTRDDFREDLCAFRDDLTTWLEGPLLKRLEDVIDDRLASQFKKVEATVRKIASNNVRRTTLPSEESMHSHGRPRISVGARREEMKKGRAIGASGMTMIFGSAVRAERSRGSPTMRDWSHTNSRTSSNTGASRQERPELQYSASATASSVLSQNRLVSSAATVGSAVGTVGSAVIGTGMSLTKTATNKASNLVSSRFGLRRKVSDPRPAPIEEEPDSPSSYTIFAESVESPLSNSPRGSQRSDIAVRFAEFRDKSNSYTLLTQESGLSGLPDQICSQDFKAGEVPGGAEEEPPELRGSVDSASLEDHRAPRAKPKRNITREAHQPHYHFLSGDADAEEEEDERRTHGCKGWAVRTLRSDRFTFSTGAMILLNAASLGLQTDYMARHWTEDVPIEYDIFDSCCCLYFLSELLLRLYVVGMRFFHIENSEFIVNVFDFFCVISIICDTAFAWLSRLEYVANYTGDAAVLVVMRGLRLVRILRFFRMLSVFAELRMLVVSLRYSIKALFWSVVMVFLLVFMTSVYLTQLVTNFKVRTPAKQEEIQELVKYYGTLDRSLLSMYEAISEGIHWGELVAPLHAHCGKWISIAFSLYMAFMIFAMLNVITGRLCECSIEVAKDDRKKEQLREMVTVFEGFDEDCDGTVTRDEFIKQLTHPKMQEFLKAVDLDEEAATTLFDVLSHEKAEKEGGCLDAKEFVRGCARINGPAKATDIAKMSKEWEDHACYVEDMLFDIFDILLERGTDSAAQESEPQPDEGEGGEGQQEDMPATDIRLIDDLS